MNSNGAPETYKGHVLIVYDGPDGITKRGQLAYHGQVIDDDQYKVESRLGSTSYVRDELKKLVDMRIAGIGLNILSSIAPNDPIEGGRLMIEVWNKYAKEYIDSEYGQESDTKEPEPAEKNGTIPCGPASNN